MPRYQEFDDAESYQATRLYFKFLHLIHRPTRQYWAWYSSKEDRRMRMNDKMMRTLFPKEVKK